MHGTEKQEMVEALVSYTQHPVGCAIYQQSWANGAPQCSCGLDALREEAARHRLAHAGPVGEVFTEALDLLEERIESHDYLGTGSNSRAADKEYREDRKALKRFRAAALASSPPPAAQPVGNAPMQAYQMACNAFAKNFRGTGNGRAEARTDPFFIASVAIRAAWPERIMDENAEPRARLTLHWPEDEMTAPAPQGELREALTRLRPPFRVDGFNEVLAGEDAMQAMIVRDDEPGCASIIAQNMRDQDAHDIVALVNAAALSASSIRQEGE